jgi:hypothetical protein
VFGILRCPVLTNWETIDVRGQWTGTYRGENVEGDMLVNVDEVGDHFECEVYIAPFDGDIPASIG